MVPQPETRPINPEQLIAKIKGIQNGLMMAESKRREVDAKQTAASHVGYQPKLNNEQWQALIVLVQKSWLSNTPEIIEYTILSCISTMTSS